MTLPDSLDRLEQLAKAATPGTWYVSAASTGEQYVRSQGGDTNYAVAECWGGRGPNADDAAFIAACDPQTILALTAEVQRLEADLAEAIGYLRQGKAQFAPNTTNSLVDDFLARFAALEGR